MTDLVERLRAALDETERVARACPGVTFVIGEQPGSPGSYDMEAYGPDSLDRFDSITGSRGIPAPYAQHIALHDPERELRMVAKDRKILDLHAPQWEYVEWPHAADDSGKNWVCPSCRPADPTDWRPEIGEAGVLPEGFVPSYTLAPCPTLTALAEAYGDEA